MLQYIEVDNNNLARSVRELSDLVYKLQKELNYKFANLIVGENVRMSDDAFIAWGNNGRPDIPDGYNDEMVLRAIEKTYIDSYGIFTPNMYATNLSVLKGKIQAAQIETLYIGQDVFMAPGATISWESEVSDKPFIPDEYYITLISKDTIKTANVFANNLTVNAANVLGVLSSASIDVQTNASIGSTLYMTGAGGTRSIQFGYGNSIYAGYYGTSLPSMLFYSDGNIEFYPGPYGCSVILPYNTYMGYSMDQVATEDWVKSWIAALKLANFYDVDALIADALWDHIRAYH